MYFALIGILCAGFATLCWRDLRLAALLFVGCLPIYLLRLSLSGIPTTALELLFWILVIVWLIRRHRPVPDHPIADPTVNLGPFLPAIIIFVFAATISVFTAPDLLAAVGIWKAYVLEPIIFFFLIRSVLSSERDRTAILDALGASALFVSIIAVAQWLTGQGIPAPWDIERRVTSIFPYPNAVGLFVGPILILGLFRFKHVPKLWLPTLILGGCAIVAAQSEAAIAGVLATAFLIGILIRRTRLPTIIAALCLVGVLLGNAPLRAFVVQKITLQDYSGMVRRTQWEETVNLLSDHPIFGAGLAGYPTALAPYHTHTDIEIFQYPHNVVLNAWVEMGLLGIIGFLLLDLAIALTAWPSIRNSVTQPLSHSTAFTLACSFALLETFIHGLVDVPYFKNDLSMMTWILIAVLSLAYVRRQPAQKSS
jgi:O-antigen ligase